MRVLEIVCLAVCLTAMVGCRARGQEPSEESSASSRSQAPAGTPAPVVRPPAVAGGFYPGEADVLRTTVQGFLAKVPKRPVKGTIVAAMAPHAGYVYSGQVAAYTHKLLESAEFDTVVIIGHDAFRGAVAFLCPVDYFETPLGRVPVDREMLAGIQAFHEGIVANQAIHDRDHTVEVQLPFFQVTGRAFKIVPVLFGNPTLENARILAEAIRAAAGDRKVLVLASTDMSHYPPYEAARTLDLATLDVLKTFDPRALFDHLRSKERAGRIPNLKTAMCASGGVLTALEYARQKGADRIEVLKYANSGDVSAGNKAQVVGYGAAVFLRTANGK